MTTVVVVRAGRHDGSRPSRYLALAETYAEVAGVLAAAGGGAHPPEPLYMLIGHAMELALKAVIGRSRCSDEGLILLGHDLTLCLRAATREGLDLSQNSGVLTALDALAMPHLAQALRYPAYVAWPLPHTQTAMDALCALLSQARKLIDAHPAVASEP